MGLTLELPEALVLLPLLAVAWFALARRGRARWWRLAALALLGLAATAPSVVRDHGGSDVVLVLDRSASMGGEKERAQEIATLVGGQRGDGDRLAIVAFGEDARLVQAPSAEGVAQVRDTVVAVDGSDLAEGLALAGSVVPPGRSARVVVVSDGELTGASPRREAARLALRGFAVDALPVARPPLPDAAVARVELPGRLERGESFIGTAELVGDDGGERAWRVVRLGGAGAELVVAEGVARLAPGAPAVVRFADRPVGSGVVRYEVRLDAAGDRVPENNRARAAVLVAGRETVLVMSQAGGETNLSRALAAAGLEVGTRAAGPLTLGELAGVRTLVLEQVPAAALGVEGMAAVRNYVSELGGGLVMTGGRQSLGTGGYYKSEVEAVLPVSLELRDEHRKAALAIALSLDRSGSMGATVAGGATKMSLANSGAVAAIELLGPRDEVTVHAVDEAVHVVVAATPAVDPAAIAAQVRGIRAMGGGIYVYEALKAAGAAVLSASQGARHVVLFADASDAEQPGDYVTLVGDLAAAGVTVSVIGLGTESDSDAALLKDVAARGNGRVWFTDRAEDLPRVFAQETLLVAHNAWISQRVGMAPTALAPTVLGSDPALAEWPAIGGYNLTYPKPDALVLARAPGDPEAPAVVVGQAGTGRSAVVAFDTEPPDDPALAAWAGYGPLVAGLARWTAGAGDGGPGALTATREGREVTLTLELDPARRAEWPAAAPGASLSTEGRLGEPLTVRMEPVDDGVYEARVTLPDDRVVIPAVALPTGPVVGPAVALPYSPEAAPRGGVGAGLAALTALARDGGGVVRADLTGVFENPPSRGQRTELAALLVALALLALVVEVATRRLALAWPRLGRGLGAALRARWSRRRRRAVTPEPPRAEAGGGTETAPPPGSSPPGAAEGRGSVGDALRELRKRRG